MNDKSVFVEQISNAISNRTERPNQIDDTTRNRYCKISEGSFLVTFFLLYHVVVVVFTCILIVLRVRSRLKCLWKTCDSAVETFFACLALCFHKQMMYIWLMEFL